MSHCTICYLLLKNVIFSDNKHHLPFDTEMTNIFSSPEPKAQRGAYRIGRHPASVRRRRRCRRRRRPPFSKIFSSDQSQILCEASIGRGNQCVYK